MPKKPDLIDRYHNKRRVREKREEDKWRATIAISYGRPRRRRS